jgi:Vacuolar-sorting associated protein 13, adaptor binding domain
VHQIDSDDPLAVQIQLPGFQYSPPADITSSDFATYIELLDADERVLPLCIANHLDSLGRRRVSIYANYWLVNKTGTQVWWSGGGVAV